MKFYEPLKKIPTFPIILESLYAEDYKVKYHSKTVKKNLNSQDDKKQLTKSLSIFLAKHPNYYGILMKNCETVKIIENKSLYRVGGFILYPTECEFQFSDEASYHELLHMASSYYDDEREIMYLGLNYFDVAEHKNYGEGLNEGYVSLLEDRDLNDGKIIHDLEDSGSYNLGGYYLAKSLAAQLEVIIGKEKMEELFFRANLYGVIEILREFLSMEEVMILLKGFDAAASRINKFPLLRKMIFTSQNIMYKIVINNFPEKLNEFENYLIDYDGKEYILNQEINEVQEIRKKSLAK